jgi:hypothetical protein
MSGPQHIPIHPRFARKPFIPQQAPPPRPPVHEEIRFNEPDLDFAKDNSDEFDLFEVASSDGHRNVDSEQKKKPYDMMIIVMAVIIIVLIIIIVWLILSNNDEPVPEKVIQTPPQYMRPPNDMAGYRYMQPPPMQQPPSMQPQQMQQQQMQPQQMQPQPPPTAEPTSKLEMDSVFDKLKQKSAKNEKLPVDQYTITDSRKREAPVKQTLETIAEEISEEEAAEDGYDEEYPYQDDSSE